MNVIVTDWYCPKCGAWNEAFRYDCYMCGTWRPEKDA